MVLGLPPSTTTASEPFGIFTRFGARSRHLTATWFRQTSGLRSMCPSPEMTLYRPIVESFPTKSNPRSIGVVEHWSTGSSIRFPLFHYSITPLFQSSFCILSVHLFEEACVFKLIDEARLRKALRIGGARNFRVRAG